MDVHIWIRKLVKEIECEVNNFTYFKEWDRAAGDGRIEFDHFWVVECIQWHDLFPLIKRVPLRPRHHSDLFLSFKDQSVSCWVTFSVCELCSNACPSRSFTRHKFCVRFASSLQKPMIAFWNCMAGPCSEFGYSLVKFGFNLWMRICS